MKISQKDLFHGAALTQLTEHKSFKALNKADGKYGHYLVNTDRRLMTKLSTKAKGPWQFTFNQDDLETIQSDIDAGYRSLVVLVCGKETICLLKRRDFSVVVDRKSNNQQWIIVDIPGHGTSMHVKGSKGVLNHAIAHNDFPDKVFT